MTGAALAALALLAAAPASAGFRYVAPAETAAGAAEPAPGPGPAVWRIHEGETLRAALSRWGARAGADVVFLTDRRYRLDASVAFEGAFPDAVGALMRGLAYLPHPPADAFSEDGRSVVVTHRVRRPSEGEGKP